MILNLEQLRVRDIMDQVDAFRIALGDARVPDSWYRLLAEDEGDRAVWQAEEFRREL